MKIRLALTIEAHRDPKPATDNNDRGEEHPPMVDGKGAFLIERAHQDEPNEFRVGFHREQP